MPRAALLTTMIAAVTMLLPAGGAAAAEIHALTPGGALAGVKAAAAAFAKQGGSEIAITSGPPVTVRQRILAGEPFDVLVQATPAMEDTEKAGLLRPGSRIGLARGGIGVVVRAGGPVPDVSTVEGFRRALLAAHKVVYGNPAQPNGSGELIVRILGAIGILAAVEPKVRFADIVPGNELVAKGEADLGLFNMTAIPYGVGVELAGPVPAPLQLYTDYDGAVMAKAAAPEPALSFVKFLASDGARQAWISAGFEILPAP
jgi:molybdate transport system substrate-binding protein